MKERFSLERTQGGKSPGTAGGALMSARGMSERRRPGVQSGPGQEMREEEPVRSVTLECEQVKIIWRRKRFKAMA